MQEDEIVTFQSGRYNDDIRECIMELMLMNMGLNKVTEVIKLILKKMAGKDIERLPSNAVKARLLIEARHLAHAHVSEQVQSG